MDHEGSAGMYVRGLCRCAACTDAHRVRVLRRRLQRYAEPIPDTVAHGKRSTYVNWGCRCGACTAANSEACRRRRNPQPDTS